MIPFEPPLDFDHVARLQTQGRKGESGYDADNVNR
jgi:hypothetical protein